MSERLPTAGNSTGHVWIVYSCKKPTLHSLTDRRSIRCDSIRIKMDSDIVNTNAANYKLLKLALANKDIIYISGPSSSGKTFLAKKALGEDRTIAYAYVDCDTITNPSKLFIEILGSLKRYLKIPRLSKVPKVLGFSDFITLYRAIVNTARNKGIPNIYVTLDRFQKLLGTQVLDYLKALVDDGEIGLVLISSEDPHHMLSDIQSFVAKCRIYRKLCFLQLSVWDKNDIVDTICLDEPKVMPDIYRKFVQNLVSVVYDANTRDFNDIKKLCRERFPHFCQLYSEKHKENIDGREEIIPKRRRKTLASTKEQPSEPNAFSSDRKSIIGTFIESFKDMMTQSELSSRERVDIDRSVELSCSALILAAFIAAYTRPSDDKQNFIKFQKRKSTRRIQFDLVAESKSFTLERLLHIHQGILSSNPRHGEVTETYVPDSALSEVQQLVDINMIEAVSSDVYSSHARYRLSSCVEREYVDRIAQQIEFSLDHVFGLNN